MKNLNDVRQHIYALQARVDRLEQRSATGNWSASGGAPLAQQPWQPRVGVDAVWRALTANPDATTVTIDKETLARALIVAQDTAGL